MTRLATRLAGYEERVRFFLGLLVLVLAAANAANFLLLRSVWMSLRDVVEETVDVRGREAADRLLLEARETYGGGSTPPALSSAMLERAAQISGCLALSLLDPKGSVVVAGDGSSPGSLDRDLPHGLVLTPPSRTDLSFHPSIHVVDRGAAMVRFQAITSPTDRKTYLVKTVHDTGDLASTGSAYRTLVWTQTIAILVVLIAAFAFGRWISRPYRMLAQEAGATALLDAEGGAEDLVATFRRVMTRLREQDAELQELHGQTRAGDGSLRRFAEDVARSMTSGLIAVDEEGRFVAANPAAGRIMRWQAAPDPGTALASWAGEGTALARLVQASLDGEPSRSREEIDHPDGSERGRTLHLGVAVSPVYGGGIGAGPERARLEGVVCLLADLTEIRELEMRVRRKEELAALGTVSAGIAHEIRNALATILGYAKLAEKGSTSPASDHARAIAREVSAIGTTVEDFLRYARPSRFAPAPLRLRVVLDQAVEDARAAGLLERVEVTVMGDEISITGDEQALRAAFSNLVRNAAESADRPVRLEISAAREGERAIVTFEDDGDGIPDEHRDRIFLPFFTTRGKGTGIGLAMTLKTVLEHDGTIGVTSSPRGGSLFRIEIPASG